ncbi:MAG: hypothetical protein CMK59_08540 [Proteobacteria bacterium]|nr:hypothetical protein [Pseudomonadota bacterium]
MLLLFLSSMGFAESITPGAVGLGVAIGSPAGFCGKLKLSELQALQFSTGSSLGVLGSISVSGDFVQHLPPLTSDDDPYVVTPYLGVGGSINARSYLGVSMVYVGPRGVGGVSVFPKELPVDFFVEMAPTLFLFESLTWAVEGSLGARYYF